MMNHQNTPIAGRRLVPAPFSEKIRPKLIATLISICCLSGLCGGSASFGQESVFALRIRSAGGAVNPLGQGNAPNWAGYVRTGGAYRSMTGSWVVPSVSYVNYPGSPAKEDSSTWIGIGGNSDPSLIQLGTAQETSPAGPKYYAWYLLVNGLQNAAIPLPDPVSPGDKIDASLQCVANCVPNAIQSWKMTIRNVTKGWSWDNSGQPFNYKSSMASAEWIMEASTHQIGGQIAELPKYGSVSFTETTLNGANPNLSLLADGLSMVNGGVPISIPTAATGGNSFAVNQTGLPPSPPLPQQPTSVNCSGPDLGELGPGVTKPAQGTLAGGNSTAYFRFFATQYFRMSATALGIQPRHFAFQIVDDITGRMMDAVHADFVLSLDPGYYCLKVFSTDGTPGVGFRVDIGAIPAGFVPPGTKASAFPLSQLELGNLSENGYYANTRYFRFLNNNAPPTPVLLDPGHEYVLRDWLGGPKPDQWYKLSLDATRTVEIKLYNMYLGATATLETEDGTLVAATVADGSPLTPLLTQQSFKGALPAATFYLHVHFAGVGRPGTPFGLWLRAN